MTTTELIKILKDNECGGISHKPRELSLTINGKYMPNPQITLSSTGDGICGAEIDLDVDGEFCEEQKTEWIPVSERLPKAEYGESDSVLVCFENETQDVLYFNGSNWCYPTGETYISVNHKNDWHNKVIAWMPLPKPYQSEVEQ